MRGSHRQFKHRFKPGRVTVAGKAHDDLAKGTLNSILKQSGLKRRRAFMRYAIVIEKAEGKQAIREAIAFHLDGLREDGLPVPVPTSLVEYVEVAA